MNATRRNIALSAVTALRLRFYTKGTIAGTKKSKKSPLVDSLEIRLRTVGPITVADYMKECLTHPKHGYYMNNDVFGTKGDFITSPEISQVFGELLGVWVAVEWQKIKDSSHLTIIELGPGRGTLASDILRTISQFDFLKDKISYHLIDVSPKMREMQKETLCLDKNHSSSQCVPSKYGSTTVSWHRSVAEVPITGNCCFIAHEFFDAMPVHKFQMREADGCYYAKIASSYRAHFYLSGFVNKHKLWIWTTENTQITQDTIMKLKRVTV